jgi:hypothetical protein
VEEMTGGSQEFTDYCAAMILELAAQSKEHDMQMLTYLFSMLSLELKDLRSGHTDAMTSNGQELMVA